MPKPKSQVFNYIKNNKIKQYLFIICIPSLLLIASLNKLDGLYLKGQDNIYGAGFLGMPIDADPLITFSDITWTHTMLYDGVAQAKSDIASNDIKFYQYGLVTPELSLDLSNLLSAYRISLKLGGCEIGTLKHRQHTVYNEYIQQSTSLNIESIINGSAEDNNL